MNNEEINNFLTKINIDKTPCPTGILKVNLKILESNINILKKHADGRAKLLFPVKGNGYGSGMIAVSKFAEKFKLCDYLGVAHFNEAYQLREAGIKMPVLILGLSYLEREDIKYIIKNNIEQSVSDKELLFLIDEVTFELKKIARIHVNIDTGMGRLGVLAEEALSLFEEIKKCKNIKLVGVMTHFPVSDSPDEEHIAYTKQQIDKFSELKNKIIEEFGEDILFHTANSGATLEHPKIFDMIRPGIATYGYPEQFGSGLKLGLEPIMEVSSKITLIKDYPKGHYIGYGRTYVTKEKEKIGVVPIGYADGLFRSFSNKLTPILNGKKTISVGRISMDQFCVKVDDKTKVGDKVLIIGKEDDVSNNAHDMARIAGTITYEIICSLGKANRLKHVYVYE